MLAALRSPPLARAAHAAVTRVRPRPRTPLRVQTTLVLLLSLPLASFAVSAPASAQTPRYAPGRAVAEALARYEVLASGADVRPPASRTVVQHGDVYAAAATLRRYLAALGDLPRLSPALVGADSVYDDVLVDGVVAFQRRHGLEPDGVIGPMTMAQMRVPLAHRARQLASTLARWQQLPDSAPERVVVVNVPAFRLYAFERGDSTDWPRLRMNVIVGQAHAGRATPLFSGTMREVVFRPYWDVPSSIARGELLPSIRRDPGYLARQHLEIVRGGDHGATVFAPTAGNLARVASGTLRLRQRPGPWNALGGVKLVFPNRYNVYLHGTPAPELFANIRRDFSHGCVRVEDPTALAEWVLELETGWDSAAIAAAMASGPLSRRVRLSRPIPVHVMYATAVVGDDGLVRFYPDIYHHDPVPAAAPEPSRAVARENGRGESRAPAGLDAYPADSLRASYSSSIGDRGMPPLSCGGW